MVGASEISDKGIVQGGSESELSSHLQTSVERLELAVAHLVIDIMTDFEVATTSKGTKMLIHASFCWTVKKVRKDDVSVWRCTGRNAFKCTATLCTKENADGQMERLSMSAHNHEPNPEEIIRIRADNIVRSAAQAAPLECVQNIIADVVHNTPVVHHVSLNERRLRRSVYAVKKRTREEFDGDHGVYTDLQSLVDLNRCESLLLSDSGPGPDRILCFGAQRHFHLFHEVGATILADGTFQVVPSLWKQQYTVHVTVGGIHGAPFFISFFRGRQRTCTRQSSA